MPFTTNGVDKSKSAGRREMKNGGAEPSASAIHSATFYTLSDPSSSRGLRIRTRGGVTLREGQGRAPARDPRRATTGFTRAPNGHGREETMLAHPL